METTLPERKIISFALNPSRVFAACFWSTGVFALVGALYTWGEGWLFAQQDLLLVMLPWADLLLTAPCSILAGYGIWKRKRWSLPLGTMTCGMYLLGSALVYIAVLWQGPPYPPRLLLPPVFGIGFAAGYLAWIWKNPDLGHSFA